MFGLFVVVSLSELDVPWDVYIQQKKAMPSRNHPLSALLLILVLLLIWVSVFGVLGGFCIIPWQIKEKTLSWIFRYCKYTCGQRMWPLYCYFVTPSTPRFSFFTFSLFLPQLFMNVFPVWLLSSSKWWSLKPNLVSVIKALCLGLTKSTERHHFPGITRKIFQQFM